MAERAVLSAATTRSPARPSPYSGGRVGGGARSSAARAASGSRSTSVFQPASTVSVHSVLGRSVMHGTPAR